MKSTKKLNLSKRTASFLVIAILLFAIAGVTGVRAMLNIQSQDYVAEFELSNLGVTLLENGTAVGSLGNSLLTKGNTPFDGTYEGGTYTPGTYKPGYRYDEVISARNDGDINVFLRINLRKYWADKDGNKLTNLDPELIQLSYGDEACGPDWMINARESTTERTTYYYKHLLLGNKDGSEAQRATTPVVTNLTIDGKIVDKENVRLVEETTEGSKTTYKYEYEYSGVCAWIEADVQALQNHNAQDSIKSLWGLTDDEFTVTVNGESEGSLQIRN